MKNPSLRIKIRRSVFSLQSTAKWKWPLLELQASSTPKNGCFWSKNLMSPYRFPDLVDLENFPSVTLLITDFLAFGWLELLESESSNFFWDVDANFVVNIFLNIVTMKCSSIHFKYVVQMLPWNLQNVIYFIIATIVTYTNCHDKTS